MEVSMDKAVAVEVPIHIIGKSKGVAEGGLVQHDHRIIKGECLPNSIPASIDVDITELEVGQSLHVKDLDLPEGFKVLEEEEVTIVSVVAPAVEEEEKTAEEMEEELKESFSEKEGEEGEQKRRRRRRRRRE